MFERKRLFPDDTIEEEIERGHVTHLRFTYRRIDEWSLFLDDTLNDVLSKFPRIESRV